MKSLKYCTKTIDGYFIINHNKITSLTIEDFPSFVGKLLCGNNSSALDVFDKKTEVIDLLAIEKETKNYLIY